MGRARNVGRIDVWRTTAEARAADTSESKLLGRMTVWLTAALARAHIDGNGGGGDTPDWVPENAKIHVDLVRAFNDQDAAAWVDGVGVVAVDTLLGSDPNTQNAWSPTEYDPDNLTADGYVDPTAENSIAAVGDLRSMILAGATVVIREKCLGALAFDNNFVLVSADANAAIQYGINIGSLAGELYSWASDIDEQIANIANVGDDAINVIALTNTPTRAEYAVNGSDPASAALTTTDFPVSGPSQIVAVVVDIGSESRAALQSITVYDPLPDTTGLSALSENGVTNTAPHDITVTWADDRGSPSFTPQEMVTGFTVGTFAATDDEGNPLTWSLTLDESSKLEFDGNILKVASDFSGDSSPNITVRAADPGGLNATHGYQLVVSS